MQPQPTPTTAPPPPRTMPSYSTAPTLPSGPSFPTGFATTPSIPPSPSPSLSSQPPRGSFTGYPPPSPGLPSQPPRSSSGGGSSSGVSSPMNSPPPSPSPSKPPAELTPQQQEIVTSLETAATQLDQKAKGGDVKKAKDAHKKLAKLYTSFDKLNPNTFTILTEISTLLTQKDYPKVDGKLQELIAEWNSNTMAWIPSVKVIAGLAKKYLK
eukprot:TRINITY_DN1606_c0_g1_i3.p1 TRINITY_DN1606_c0_g1~~TRINITY_DN1606_c0_g1_i3.p1  ORF type:complete len:211 (+),score=30.87 TRINITY_DN1606_c0_g1_i3:78-710(+)